jgi:hypothetical protein
MRSLAMWQRVTLDEFGKDGIHDIRIGKWEMSESLLIPRHPARSPNIYERTGQRKGARGIYMIGSLMRGMTFLTISVSPKLSVGDDASHRPKTSMSAKHRLCLLSVLSSKVRESAASPGTANARFLRPRSWSCPWIACSCRSDTGKTMDSPRLYGLNRAMDLQTDQVQPYHYPNNTGLGLR